MLKGNNLIWKSRQTTDSRENSQCCNKMPVNSRLLWKHKEWHMCNGNIFINMLPRKI